MKTKKTTSKKASTKTTSKFKNKKVTLQSQDHKGNPITVTFDSMGEYKRWLVLFGDFRAGRISMLRRQVRYRLFSACGNTVCRYVADFVYMKNGRLVVEDFKSAHTAKLPMYRLKKKWLKADYGIEILESYRA